MVHELIAVRADVATLAAAISEGNLAKAQSDWLAAHLEWLGVGQDDGAYGCFGDLGGEIDGTAAGLVGGTASPQFTGFHRSSGTFWTDGNLAEAATDDCDLAANW